MLYQILLVGWSLISCSAQEKTKAKRRTPLLATQDATVAPSQANAPQEQKHTKDEGVNKTVPAEEFVQEKEISQPQQTIDPKAQPVVSGLASIDKCVGITPNPADCSAFCTVVVCGEEAGVYDGDLDGKQPIFKFKYKGDKYCGGTGKQVTVEVACRKSNQSTKFEFINPGAPESGPANRGSPYRWEKNFYSSKGMLWKSAEGGGKGLYIYLSHDFRNDVP